MSATDSNRLLAEERRRAILGVLARDGRITVGEISKRFGVSAVTARTDLNALSESGALIRSRGGGIRPLAAVPEHPLKARESMHREEKLRIARHAASLIRPGQTVILCTGSTSALLASEIAVRGPERLTVITHALNIATILGEMPNISLVMLGGVLRHPSGAFIGPQAEHMMGTLHADHCFLSAVGVDPHIGITTLDIMEAHLNGRMIDASAEVTVLADSSKLGHRSLAVVADVGSVQRIITDTQAAPELVQQLQEQDVEVFLA